MDPSIMKLLEDDEDETMHSGVDVEAFQAALNRDIGGDVSASQFPGSDAVLSQGSNNTSSQSSSQWPTSNHDSQSDGQNQEPKTAQEQHPSEMEPKQHGSLGEHLQHVASQDVNNIHLSQKQSQDDSHQTPAVQVPLHNSQTIGIHNSGKDSVLNKEVVKSHNPSSESQYAKLQQMSNQQATVSEQPSSQVNRSNKQVPFGLLLPILLPQLAKDRAMQLQTLFTKLKKDEIPKDSFVRLMKGIVGDQMLRLALAKVQMQPQARPNQASAGQQLPVRMPTVSSGARQLNDPHALAQMHQRSMNVAVDQSRMSSSAGQTMDSNARKSQEFDVKIESQGLQPNQLTSSTSNSVAQETERASVHIQGLNKQQQHHLHFASAYGNSGGNYNPYSGTTGSSTSSIKPQSHDSHMSQIPHQSIGSNHLGGSTHGLSVIGMPKLEQQNSFNDPKRLPGGSVSSAVNNAASQQTSNAWQPSTNKEQNLGLMSSVSYVKKEPGDMSTEQQNRHNLSKLHGYSSVNSAQLEQSGASQGALKDEFSRGLPASTSMPSTTSSGLLPHSSASASAVTHLDSSVLIPSNASGIAARPSLKKSAATQKKPLEALGSSPPPSSKKQKTSGGYAEQSIEQLNDVTAVSGVDLREEEEQLFSGPKEDSRVSEASRKAVQEEEERLILQKAPLQKKLIDIMAKCGLKGMSNDVEKCLSLSVEERMRGLISNLIRLSKQRVDFEKTRHRIVVTSDVRQQIMTINRKVRDEWEKKQAEAEKLRKLNDVDSNTGGDGDKDKDDGRAKSTKVNKEEDDKMRTNAANVAARAAYGGDDMLSKWQLMAEQAKQKREGGVDVSSSSQPAKDVNRKSSSTSERSTKDNQEGEKRGSTPFLASSVARKLGKSHAMAPQTRVARSISVKDVIAVLEREPQMSKSPLIHRLYEKIHSEAPVEQEITKDQAMPDSDEKMEEDQPLTADDEHHNDKAMSDSDDSDSEDEAQQNLLLESLQTELAANPSNYDGHLQYIKLLRRAGDVNKLIRAREVMSELFPLSPEMWHQWIKDELSLSTASRPESFSRILKLYERGVFDYLSISLWCDYINFVQEFDPMVRQCTPTGISKVRDLFESALTAAGLHVAEGSKIWEAYRQYEQAILLTIDDTDAQAKEKQVHRIRSLFHRQFSVPLADMSSTLAAYKAWEAEQRNLEDVETIDLVDIYPHVASSYQKALEMYNARFHLEEQILSLNVSDSEKLQHYMNYLKFEQSHGMPARVQVLYERAITDFPISPDLWLDYTRYLDNTLKVGNIVSNVYSRATKNCPWVGELWIRYMLSLERGHTSEKALSEIFEKSLQCTFSTVEEYLDLFLTRVDGLRRRMTSSSEEDLEYKIIRETFERASDYLSPHLKNTEGLLHLYMYWTRLETKLGKDVTAARGVWENCLKICGSMLQSWTGYIAMEVELGHINEARSIYKRCYSKRLSGTGSEDICHSWLRFEREFGTLEDFDHASLKVTPRLEELQLFRIHQESKSAEENEKNLKRNAREKRKLGSDITEEPTPSKRLKDIGNTKKTPEENKYQQQNTSQVSKVEGVNWNNPSGQQLNLEKNRAYSDKCTAFISNLHPTANYEHIRNFFSDVGGIVAIRVLHDKFTGKSRGLAYVDFLDDEHLAAALAKNKQKLIGQKLSIARSDPRRGGRESSNPKILTEHDTSNHYGKKSAVSKETDDAYKGDVKDAKFSSRKQENDNIQLRGKNTFAVPRNVRPLGFTANKQIAEEGDEKPKSNEEFRKMFIR